MNRTKFYNKVIVNGISEVDFLYNTLSAFTMRHTPSYYRLNSHDSGQPDFISKKMYNTERYWWIICLVNKIENPLVDLTEGLILTIPSIYDIYDFYQEFSTRS